MSVVNWINGFNPQTVNNKDFQMPPDLKELSNYTKMLLKEFPGNPQNMVP